MVRIDVTQKVRKLRFRLYEVVVWYYPEEFRTFVLIKPNLIALFGNEK